MISFIKGQLSEILEDCIVVENQNIGFEIRIPSRSIGQLPALDEEVKIYTYMYVKEDEISLYGFTSRDDVFIFKQLITVSGIGPKGALAILSTLSSDEIRLAVMNEDAKSVSKAPGVGLKTAQKMIIELKGKLGEVKSSGNDIPAVLKTQDLSDSRAEAIAALTALGYSNSEAVAAVKAVDYEEGMDAEAVLKASLKHLTMF